MESVAIYQQLWKVLAEFGIFAVIVLVILALFFWNR